MARRAHARGSVLRSTSPASAASTARSSRSNTEVGLVIDNAELAAEAMALMQQHWSHSHYRLRLAGGGVEWLAADGDDTVVHRAEPYVGWLKRLRLGVTSLFVSEDLL